MMVQSLNWAGGVSHGGRAQELAAQFRSMSRQRDAIVDSVGAGGLHLQQRSSPSPELQLFPSLRSPPLLDASAPFGRARMGGDLHAVGAFGVSSGKGLSAAAPSHARTIVIGGSVSRSTSPQNAPLFVDTAHVNATNEREGSFGAAFAPLRRSQQPAVRTSSAVVFGNSGTFLPLSGAPPPGSGRNDGGVDAVSLRSTAVVRPPMAADEDALTAVQTPPRGAYAAHVSRSQPDDASPREFAPEYDFTRAPQAVRAVSADSVTGDAFERHRAALYGTGDSPPSGRHLPSEVVYVSTPGATAAFTSPLPKPPLVGRGAPSDNGADPTELAGTSSLRRVPSSRSGGGESVTTPNSSMPPSGFPEPRSQFHLVGDQSSASGAPMAATMDFNGVAVPIPPALTQGPLRIIPTSTRTSSSQVPYRHLKPSKFLSALVESVAVRKGATMIPAIPSPIVEAFDSVVRDGAYFIKYAATGAPHERFFQIRFVEIQGQAPEPCLSWSLHRNSWSARGVVNLAGIVRVCRDTDTYAFRRHLIDDGRHIHGPMIDGARRAVLPTTSAFHIDCVPSPDGVVNDHEPLSLIGSNSDILDSWLAFLDFICSIGTAEEGGAALSS